jgi:protein SCO1/2
MPATAFDLQAKFVREYGRAGADKGVHFLCACDVPVPEREKTIKELCDAVGFRFEYDAKSKQFNHASAITVITAYGKISKYIFGLAYQPKEVDAALQEAGAGKIGQEEAEPSKLVSLFCYARDDETGKYSFSIMKVLRILFGTMVLGIAIWLIRAWRQPPKSVSLTQVGQASSLTDESH